MNRRDLLKALPGLAALCAVPAASAVGEVQELPKLEPGIKPDGGYYSTRYEFVNYGDTLITIRLEQPMYRRYGGCYSGYCMGPPEVYLRITDNDEWAPATSSEEWWPIPLDIAKVIFHDKNINWGRYRRSM